MTEYGGLRWGASFWNAANATWPFATWRLAGDCLDVQVHAWPLITDHFVFAKKDVISLRITRGVISSGVRIEHSRPEYPPFILFWSFSAERVLSDAGAVGFPISN